MTRDLDTMYTKTIVLSVGRIVHRREHTVLILFSSVYQHSGDLFNSTCLSLPYCHRLCCCQPIGLFQACLSVYTTLLKNVSNFILECPRVGGSPSSVQLYSFFVTTLDTLFKAASSLSTTASCSYQQCGIKRRD